MALFDRWPVAIAVDIGGTTDIGQSVRNDAFDPKRHFKAAKYRIAKGLFDHPVGFQHVLATLKSKPRTGHEIPAASARPGLRLVQQDRQLERRYTFLAGPWLAKTLFSGQLAR
jgi:hypothetical protein